MAARSYFCKVRTRIIQILLFTITGLLSCTTNKVAASSNWVSLQKEHSIVLPSFSGSVYDWKIVDSLVFISSSNGIYFTNIHHNDKWNKLGSTAYKSIELLNFKFADGSVAIVIVALALQHNLIHAFVLDLHNNVLKPISAGEIPSGVDQTVQLVAARIDTTTYIWVSGLRGLIEQWQLYDPGWGQVDGRVVRQFTSPMFNKFLVLSDQMLCGAYPDKGWWTMKRDDSKQRVWLMDKNKAFKGKRIHSITVATIQGKPSILVLFEGGELYGFDPYTGKQVVPIKLDTPVNIKEAEVLLTDSAGKLKVLYKADGKWILETYSKD